jgi:multisubunit Na+/H+ antiporter MnhG subunit
MIKAFVAAAALSALAGLAALLRSDRPLTRKLVAATLLNSGLMGLGLSLFWYVLFRDNLYCLVGMCVLFALGGMGSVDIAVAAAQKKFNQWFDKDKP